MTLSIYRKHNNVYFDTRSSHSAYLNLLLILQKKIKPPFKFIVKIILLIIKN